MNTYEVRITFVVNNPNLVQFYVEVLVDRVEDPCDGEIVFQFDGDLLPREGFEK